VIQNTEPKERLHSRERYSTLVLLLSFTTFDKLTRTSKLDSTGNGYFLLCSFDAFSAQHSYQRL